LNFLEKRAKISLSLNFQICLRLSEKLKKILKKCQKCLQDQLGEVYKAEIWHQKALLTSKNLLIQQFRNLFKIFSKKLQNFLQKRQNLA
jgi:hypothetical protein